MKTFLFFLVGIALAVGLSSCALPGNYDASVDAGYDTCSQNFLDEYNNVKLTEEGGNNADACAIFFNNYSGVTCDASVNGLDTVLSSDDLLPDCRA